MTLFHWLLPFMLGGECCASATAGPVSRPDRPQQVVIGNCIGADKLAFRRGVTGVMLNADDTAEVAGAIINQYPMIERDGLYPTAIALWRRPGGDWLYATLAERAKPPNAPCFTANVVAAQVKLTPVLLKKYFGTGQALVSAN
jgi:hypothetical protein